VSNLTDPLNQEVLVSHANARLTLFGGKLLVDRVAAGHKPVEVAKQLGVSRQTVYKWVRRYHAEGLAGLVERSSRPHRMPRALSPAAAARIRAARLAEHAVTGAASCAAWAAGQHDRAGHRPRGAAPAGRRRPAHRCGGRQLETQRPAL